MVSIEADWRKLVELEQIDLIDIASPNDINDEIAIAAAKAGKIVNARKAAGTHIRRSRGHGGRGGIKKGAEHGLV